MIRRDVKSINRDWLYRPEFREEFTDKGYVPDGGWQAVGLPHTNRELPYNGFDEKEYQFVSTYRRELPVPAVPAGDRVILDFEGVMTACDLWIDGKAAGGHDGGYTPFAVDITDLCEPGGTCVLTVRVDSTEREDIPPFGKVVDYLTYGGIYREVSLRTVPAVYIENLFARPGRILEREKELTARVFIRNTTDREQKRTLSLSLSGTAEKEQPIAAPPGDSVHEITLNDLSGLSLWTPENPALYTVRAELTGASHEGSDLYEDRTGFRTAEFRDTGFFLNGQLLKIRGLNRHQSYPYAGYAMPKREQRQDADRLKYELGLNLVRTSHYPQSRHFLDRCDEIGLLVFEEIPGWQHIGDGTWKENACRDVRDMIRRDWNRPSIILWGVRINESEDDHDFYAETNRIARELDDTRQTGGVRYIAKSEFLEDVYTMNDFIHGGGKEILRPRKKVTGKKKVPYLITEHNGHMYPTKRFDQEERVTEHALRHLRVLHRAMGDPQISGAIGWCAWDYNTHREFGSGDRICYHGVSDMFRIPKYAAAVYASQMSPDVKVVMEAASLFAKGERSAARILPIKVFTNCDAVKVCKNGREIGTFLPARDEYPHLEHPPVIIRDVVGKQVDELPFSEKDRNLMRELVSYVMINGEEQLKLKHYLRLAGLMQRNKLKFSEVVSLFMRYNAGWGEEEDTFEIAGILKGREVVRKTYGSGRADRLTIKADGTELTAGDWDTQRVEFRLVDQYGNIMPFVNEYIRFEVEGPGEVIGPELTALTGGVCAVWIRSHGTPGEIRVRGVCSRFASDEVVLTVREEAGADRETASRTRRTICPV